jgi:hypothetical protein
MRSRKKSTGLCPTVEVDVCSVTGCLKWITVRIVIHEEKSVGLDPRND